MNKQTSRNQRADSSSWSRRLLPILAIFMLYSIASPQVGGVSNNMLERKDLPGLDAHLKLIDFYRKAAQEAFDEGNYAVAERIARRGESISQRPGSFATIRGEALIRLGLFEEALFVLKESKPSVQDRSSFARIGWLLARLGKTEESFSMVSAGLLELVMPKSMLEYVPKVNSKRNLELYWLLEVGIFTSSDPNNREQAIFYYSAAQKIKPNDSYINLRLGDSYMVEKNYKAAADCYRRVKTGISHIDAHAGNQLRQAERMIRKQKVSAGG